MSTFDRDDYCFACGPRNPIGLKLQIQKTDEGAKTVFIPRKEYQGFHKVLHGGITATLLDEVMVWAAFLHGYPVATAKLDITFRRPIAVETPITAYARLLDIRDRRIHAEAIAEQNGKKVAQARAILARITSK